MRKWMNKWINKNQATSEKVNNRIAIYTCWKREKDFLQKSDSEYINDSRAGLILKSSY